MKEQNKWEPVNEDGYKWPWNKSGPRRFAGSYWPKELSYSDKGRLIDLCEGWLIRKTNILGHKIRTGLCPLTASQIAELVGLRERQGYEWVRKMIQLRVILRVVDTEGSYMYMVNPACININGDRLTPMEYMFFRKELDPLLTSHVRRQLQAMARELPQMKCDVKDKADKINAVAAAEEMLS